MKMLMNQSVMVFLALVVVTGIAASEGRRPSPVERETPGELPADWWAQAQQDIAEREYRVTWQERTCLEGVEAAWQAPNRAHGLRTYFTEEGPRVVPRTESEPSWVWGLELVGYGTLPSGSPDFRTTPFNSPLVRGRTLGSPPYQGGAGGGSSIPPAERFEATGNRVEYRREGGLVEWYVNDRRGLEQGFTIAASPSPLEREGRGEGEITLDLAVRGNLIPSMTADGNTVEFLTEGGVGVMRYGQLHACDAEGKDLPARMELLECGGLPPLSKAQASLRSPKIVRLVVDAGDATYPITLDPVASSADWFAESNQAYAFFGEIVATAGDVNGDGFDDVIIAALYYDNGQIDEGRAFVYHGSPSGLSSAPAWSAEGNQAGAQFSCSVSTAGDVNGDGYDDVIVGAHQYDNGESDEGGAFVYHGSPSGLSSAAAWSAEGNQAGANFGFSVSTAGDVNGDGYEDVIVGAPIYTNRQIHDGRAFIYYGSSSGLSLKPEWRSDNDGSPAWAHAVFGYSVSTAGDINGDGYGDIIVGAFQYTDNDLEEWEEGWAFVYYGSASGPALTADWSAESNTPGAGLGCRVATAGDVNGDGYDDILVGAPFYSGGPCNGSIGGRVFVWHGSASGLGPHGTPLNAHWSIHEIHCLSFSTAGDVNGDGYSDVILQQGALVDRAQIHLGSVSGLSSTAWVATCEQELSSFGSGVSTAGDVNGDGYSDVIIGARNYDNGQTDEGRAFVFHGSALGMRATVGWFAESNQTSAEFGRSVSTAGDVNGDGYGDVIVGAPLYDNGEADEGMVFVFHGSSSGLSPTFDWAAEINQASAEFGCSVAAAGDVNGDGYDDIIVGAHLYDNGETDEGGAFVWFGSASGLGDDGTPANADWSAEGGQAGAEFGCSVATAGDINGDGFDDVIVGAFWCDNGENEEGMVFVFHGSASGLSASADWSAESNQDGAMFGSSVASAGDVNGDAYGDIIAGGNPGVYAWHGSASGLGANGTPANADWFAGIGFSSWGIPMTLASAGDVNGDGYGDVIVGEPMYSEPAYLAGRACVYLGSPAGLSASFAWSVEGDEEYKNFGHCVSTAGDINGDGCSDVIVGVPLQDTIYGYNEGRAFVYHGSPWGLSSQAASARERDFLQFLQYDAESAWSVSTAGDVNGDGYDDFIVGAPYYDYGECEEGLVFLYYGARTPLQAAGVQQWSVYK